MARWQPPHPDPHKGKTRPWEYRTTPRISDQFRAQIPEHLRCVFPD